MEDAVTLQNFQTNVGNVLEKISYSIDMEGECKPYKEWHKIKVKIFKLLKNNSLSSN